MAAPPHPPATGPKPRRRLARRCLDGACGAAAAALGLAVAVGATLWLRIAEAPRVVVAEAAAEMASEAFGGAGVSIGRAALVIGAAESGGVALALEDLRVEGRGGSPALTAPRARAELSAAALLSGALRPRRIVVEGAGARLVRGADGRFALDFAEPGAAEAGPPPDPGDGALARLAALLVEEDGALGALEEVVFEDARAAYLDAVSGHLWRGAEADFRLRRDGEAVSGSGSVTLTGATGRPMRLAAEGSRAPGGDARLSLVFENLAPADLASKFPRLAPIAALDAPVEGAVEAAFDADGALRAVEGALTAGPGRVVLGAVAEAFSAVEARFSFDPARLALDVESLRVDGERARAVFTGRVDLSDVEGGAVVEASAADVSLDAPGLFAGPVSLDRADALMRVRLDPLAIDLADLQIARGALRARASGWARFGPDGPSGELDASASGGTGADVLALWPTSDAIAPEGRAWVAESLRHGRMGRARAWARFGPGDEALWIDFDFAEGVVSALPTLPPIEDARGWATVTLDRLELTLAEGRVVAPGGGAVDLAGSAVRLPDLGADETPAELDLRGAGAAADVLAILDLEPFGFPAAAGIDPRSVEGRVAGRARVALPLLLDPPLERVSLDVAAELRDVALVAPRLGAPVSAEALSLAVDTAALRLEGPAVVDGVPVSLALEERFEPAPGAPRTVVDLELTATPERLRRFGVDLAGVVEGPAYASARVELRDGADPSLEARIDLRRAALSVAPIGWSKPRGERASASLRASLGAQPSLERFAVSAPGLLAEGVARFDDAGGLRALALDRLRLGDAAAPSSDLSLDAALEDGSWRLSARGPLADVRDFEPLFAEGAAGGGGDAGPLIARLDLARLDLGERLFFEPIKGTIEVNAAGGLSGRFDGLVGGAASTSLTLGGSLADARMELDAEDAGGLLRAAGVFDGGHGGALRVRGRLSDAAPRALDGTAWIRGMRVIDDPALAAMLADTEDVQAREALGRAGVAFDVVKTRFRLDERALRVEDGFATGPSVCVTYDGRYELGPDRLDVDGVLTPLCPANMALTHVPLIGQLLTDRYGEGIFALNFRIRGAAADPDVDVDMMSILAPGMLRRLFRDGEAVERREDGRRD